MPYIGRSTEAFGVRTRYTYTPSAGDTSVSGADVNGLSLSFTDGAYVDVFLNGVRLKHNTDYVTTTANTIGSLAALAASDEVEVVVFDVFSLADMVSSANGGNFFGQVNLKTDSGVIGFGADSEITLTHSADSGLLLKHTATSGSGASLTLQTGDTDIAQGNSLGSIQFQAPDEATGTDAIQVAGFIDVKSVGDFSSSNNATEMRFATGNSAAAGSDGGLMTLGTTGDLTIKDLRTADGSSPTLTLQTGDTDIAQNDILGTVAFQAPDEGTGTDAILVAASIQARSEGDFSSSSNATELVFNTGASEAAANKMKLGSGGDLSLVVDGASIFFGADSEIELRHVADDGLILKHVGTGDGKEPSLTFQAGDNDIAADDVLGQINFQAPDEGAGTDAILTAGHIKSISLGDFSSTNNEALLEFATGDSDAAGADGGRLRLKPTGLLELKDMRTADGSSPTLVLQTGDTDIAQNDILGTINFQAPDEGAGTDAILVAAGIDAISEGDFSSSSNATSLRFKVGASEAAVERMRLTSAGRLGINTTSPDALIDVEGTTESEIRLTRTTASFSSSNTDGGPVLHIVNNVEFENGYGGDSSVGQILFTSNDSSTGAGIRAKIACHKTGFGHTESLCFHVSPANTTTNQAAQSGTNHTSKGKALEIHYEGTVSVGGDLFNDSGDRTFINPTGFVFNMKDVDTRGIQFSRGATDNQAGDGDVLGNLGARANTDNSNTMATASAKIVFEQAGASSGTSAGCGFKIFTKDTTIGPGSAPTAKFAISSDGNLTASDTNIGSISDERLKKNIQDYAYDLDKFKQFKPRTFEWRNPTMHTFEDTTGFVAQELSAIDSSLSYDKEGTIDKPYADTEVYKEGDTIPSGKKVGDLLPDAQEKKDAYDAEVALLSGDKQKAAKLGKKDAMYVSVIQQLITRIEALESK